MRETAIIGTGNIGGRHLQGMALLKQPANIYIVDPSRDNLERAEGWFKQKNPGDHLQLMLCSSIDELPQALDIVIVATSANIRAALTEELLAKKRVHNLILEKVLFQTLEDYDRIESLLAAHGCKTWVNCPRRTVERYQWLAEIFKKEKHMQFYASGGGWGLACNSVHQLDLLALLTGDADFTLDASGLDAKPTPSKREGFIEYHGCLRGHSNACETLSIIEEEGEAPMLITLQSQHALCVIEEFNNKLVLMRAENRYEPETYELGGKYQSDLTGLVADEILDTGNCALSTYDESARIHKAFLKAMLAHMNRNGEGITLCPIT